MNKELVKRENSGVKTITEQTIKNYLFGSETKLTPQQQKLFVELSIRNNLDPFKREIYAIPFGSKFNIVTGYEVYLKRAERTGKLDGWGVITEGELTETKFHIKQHGKWTDIKGWDGNLKAIITIHRKDFSHPFIHEVFWNEYNAKNSMWYNKPYTMLKKVVMSQGFRLAFPDELGGMPYTVDEMQQNIDEVHVELVPKSKTKPETKKPVKKNLAKPKTKPDPKKNAKPDFNILQEFGKLKKFFNTIRNSELYYKILKDYKVAHCNELVAGADMECLETLKNALTKAQYSYIEDIASAFEKVNLKNEFVEYTKKYCQQTRVKKILKCKDNLILNNYIKDIIKYYEDILSGKNAEPVPDDTEYNDENLPFDEEEGL